MNSAPMPMRCGLFVGHQCFIGYGEAGVTSEDFPSVSSGFNGIPRKFANAIFNQAESLV